MHPVREVGLVVIRELTKTFRSARGLILLGLAVLGGATTALLLVKFEQFRASQLKDVPAEGLHELRVQFLSQVYGDREMGRYLADAPEVLLAMLGLTVWLTPLAVALFGFDGISGELQHRSVRYFTVRLRRSSYVVGKFFGLWFSVSVMTFVMHLFVWCLCILRGEANVGAALGWGFRFWLISLPMSAAWSAMAVCVGSLVRTPFLALFAILAAFFAVWLASFIGGIADVEALPIVYPNHWDRWLLSPKPERILVGALASFATALLCLVTGALIFQRRDV